MLGLSWRQPTRSGAPEEWRVLSLLSLYRLLLVSLLILALQTHSARTLIERVDPDQLRVACLIYGCIALVLLPLLRWRRLPLATQAHAGLLGDWIGLSLLMYACGGVPAGLGALLIVPVVGGGLVLSTRMTALQAALGTLAMFAVEIARRYELDFNPNDITVTGVLGLMLFGTGLAANAVAQRARRSEAIAERVGSEFEDLSRLNQTIVSTMQAGMLVVDADLRLRRYNPAAARQLRLTDADLLHPLGELAPALDQSLRQWRVDGLNPLHPVAASRQSEVLPRYSRLGAADGAPILLLLDDAELLREQAQQLKLAALGRLSANIAHEIRNPLSAIHQATQLLAESDSFGPEAPPQDKRLLGMIERHSGRIDKIVRDVLAMSRREAPQPQRLLLKEWLVATAGLYQEGHARKPRPIELLEIAPTLSVRFDPHHLQQVLFNLWDNAFRHGSSGGSGGDDEADVLVLVDAAASDGAPWLDVMDNGPGIPEADAEHLFEPFFTTAREGTGLGLFVTRELCEYNQARIHYRPTPGRGACFRIRFAAA